MLLLSLISPIDTYADDLFWVHMTQHMVLVMAAAPLLVLGAPATLALRAATPRVRRAYLVPLLGSRAVRTLTQPVVALLVFLLSIWIWHIPALYTGAIESEALHFLEHLAFLTGGLLFWFVIIGVDASDLRPGHVGRIALLIVALLSNLALSVILTFSDEPLYDTYVAAAALRAWGPDALNDQKIGAGIMWVPGTMMLALAILGTVYYWAEREGFNGRRGDMLRDRERQRRASRADQGSADPGASARGETSPGE